jgi:aminomethyltransferase
MGPIHIHGREAEAFLDYVSTNQIAGKKNYTATYTVWCRQDGTCIDDVIVYRRDSEHFHVIANASNRQKDFNHLLEQADGWDVEIVPDFEHSGILALQGPLATSLIAKFFTEAVSLKPMHWLEEKGVYISTTGYTGAGGYELYAKSDVIKELWNRLLMQGEPLGIQPAGLGARDTLRLEMGFALYGHELSDEIKANESVSAWTIKWDKDFLGKEALIEWENNSLKRNAYGIKMKEPGIPRQGFSVLREGEPIGIVTSGSFSPTLKAPIALILSHTPLQTGESVEIEIRQTRCRSEVADLPFIT